MGDKTQAGGMQGMQPMPMMQAQPTAGIAMPGGVAPGAGGLVPNQPPPATAMQPQMGPRMRFRDAFGQNQMRRPAM